MIGKRFRSLPFIFANDNYTLSAVNDWNFCHNKLLFCFIKELYNIVEIKYRIPLRLLLNLYLNWYV